MKNSKVLFSLLSTFVLVFGLTLSGCSEKTEEEAAAADVAAKAEDGAADAAAAAEKEAAKLKEEAEKALPKK
ncbi:hypothetical protein VDG1235_3655 [Verrucomicrobiia bacterium DG1235]|nr:hypothetical protein VDG1235_3655 [Verrucomicrobiae bacterium DG1235]